MGCPLPREKRGEKERSEEEAEREGKRGRGEGDRDALPQRAQTLHDLPRGGATVRERKKREGEMEGEWGMRGWGGREGSGKMADKLKKTLTWKKKISK